MGVAGPTASSQALQGACAEHLVAILSEDVPTAALFLELQESRTVQTGRTPSGAQGTWVTLHTGVSPTLFSSLALREGELSNSRAQGC